MRPAGEDPPGHRFETGTQSHEAMAGTVAAIDYLRSLGDGALDVAFERIQAHEDALGAALPRRPAGRRELYGIRARRGAHADVLLQRRRRGPRAVAERLGERGIYVWDGDYYALEPMRALGLAERGGAVRAGFLHYTTADEVDRLLDALASGQLLSGRGFLAPGVLAAFLERRPAGCRRGSV